jgi:hypothetical protein
LSLFHVLLSALKQLAALQPLAQLGRANVLLAVWSLIVTLPYSARQLGTTVHAVVALCGAMMSAPGLGAPSAEDISVDGDSDPVAALPSGVPIPSAWDSVGPTSVTHALSFLLQCVYALYPATTLAACRAVVRDTPAAGPSLTSCLSSLRLHPSLLADSSEELDQVLSLLGY